MEVNKKEVKKKVGSNKNLEVKKWVGSERKKVRSEKKVGSK